LEQLEPWTTEIGPFSINSPIAWRWAKIAQGKGVVIPDEAKANSATRTGL
jgi:hypothetical protein